MAELKANATTTFELHLAEDFLPTVRQLSVYRAAWHEAQAEIEILQQQVAALQAQIDSSQASPEGVIPAGVTHAD